MSKELKLIDTLNNNESRNLSIKYLVLKDINSIPSLQAFAEIIISLFNNSARPPFPLAPLRPPPRPPFNLPPFTFSFSLLPADTRDVGLPGLFFNPEKALYYPVLPEQAALTPLISQFVLLHSLYLNLPRCGIRDEFRRCSTPCLPVVWRRAICLCGRVGKKGFIWLKRLTFYRAFLCTVTHIFVTRIYLI